MATEREVGRALAATMPGIPSFKPPASAEEMDVLVRAYHRQLGHLDAETVQAAFDLAASRSEFMPSAGTVLAAATELTTRPQRSGDDAWGDVKAAIAEHGVYHPPDGAQYGDFRNYFWEFKDPLVGKLVKALGWTYLCQSEDEMADRAHFRKSYEVEQARARDEARLTPALAAFQAEQRAALPAPGERRDAALALMSGIGKGKR